MYRTGLEPMWQFYTDYQITQAPADAGPATIDWDRFIANAPRRGFDIDRFFTWRRWFDYGTGIAGDLQSHVVDGVNMIVEMGIPESCATQGGIYFWKDGRDVPDVWNASFNYPSQDLQVTFSCEFHNQHYGEWSHLFGRDMSMEVSPNAVKLYAEQHTDRYREMQAAEREKMASRGLSPRGRIEVPAVYEYSGRDGLQPTSHMHDFLTCARTRKQTRCHMDVAFHEAATVAMSVQSYQEQRMVRWDPVREEIV